MTPKFVFPGLTVLFHPKTTDLNSSGLFNISTRGLISIGHFKTPPKLLISLPKLCLLPSSLSQWMTPSTSHLLKLKI